MYSSANSTCRVSNIWRQKQITKGRLVHTSHGSLQQNSDYYCLAEVYYSTVSNFWTLATLRIPKEVGARGTAVSDARSAASAKKEDFTKHVRLSCNYYIRVLVRFGIG